MGDDKKARKGGGFLKKLVMLVVVLAIGAYAGYFAYAKATGQPDC